MNTQEPSCRKFKLSAGRWTTSLLIVGYIIANAQTDGVITGRVVNDEGSGVPNLPVHIFQAPTGQRGPSGRAGTMVVTDEDGNFRITGLSPSLYSVNVGQMKEYAVQPSQAFNRREQRYYRVGDNITITLVKGGVITGRVTAADGRPMVGVQVGATMVRDAEGHPVRQSFGGRPRMTDDRGIYRLYGLMPGTYIVSTNGRMMYSQMPTFQGSVTTYHPSSTRDTAAEMAVTSGGEVTGADIRFRDERGHVISGTVTVASAPNPSSYTSVSLLSVTTGMMVGSGFVRPDASDRGFAVHGVTDGEYEIFATSNDNEGMVSTSTPRRVTVRGADITGIELKLTPLSSVSGQVVVESSANICESKSQRSIQEIMIFARSEEKTALMFASYFTFSSHVVVNDKGQFTIPSLSPSGYRFEIRLPREDWYAKSITLPAPAGARRTPAGRATNVGDASRAGLELKSGDKVTGITVTVAEGAAGLSGKVVAEGEGARLPSRSRVHLVPVDPALSNDVLRYAEVLMSTDGTFVFVNLAPGRYWVLACPVPDDEPVDRPARRSAWDGADRAKLRMEAEAKKLEVELKPCQRVSDFSIRF
jgi:protocatechuate 3,4-dioxygenase beta subunit